MVYMMDDTANNTHQFGTAAPVHDVSPEAFASTAASGGALYLVVLISFALAGLLYREIRNLRLLTERLVRGASFTAIDVASVAVDSRSGSAEETSQ
jgi:hypothetical protein